VNPDGDVLLQSRDRLNHIVGRIHLIYLGLLPSVATYAVLRMYGYALPFLLFLVGVAAVGVYLAATYSYAYLPKSLWMHLVVLLDGPLFALVGWRARSTTPLAFAIDSYLIDGTAVWLAVLFLAMVSFKPTRGQRIASIAIMVLILGMVGSLFWPYVRSVLWGRWLALASLAAGLIEGTVIRVRTLDREAIARPESDFSTLYIALLVMVWVGSMMGGLAANPALPPV